MVNFDNPHFHSNLLLHSSETQQFAKYLECTYKSSSLYTVTYTIYLIFMFKKWFCKTWFRVWWSLFYIRKSIPFPGYVDALQKRKLPTLYKSLHKNCSQMLVKVIKEKCVRIPNKLPIQCCPNPRIFVANS